jgi:hypothetical protein
MGSDDIKCNAPSNRYTHSLLDAAGVVYCKKNVPPQDTSLTNSPFVRLGKSRHRNPCPARVIKSGGSIWDRDLKYFVRKSLGGNFPERGVCRFQSRRRRCTHLTHFSHRTQRIRRIDRSGKSRKFSRKIHNCHPCSLDDLINPHEPTRLLLIAPPSFRTKAHILFDRSN